MKHFIPFFAVVALSYAQFTTTEGPSQIIGVPGPRWQGPFANHILGQPVGDTPEVAAAKAAHYQAHARILEIVPVLPYEEQYKTIEVAQTQPQIHGSHQEYLPKKHVHFPENPSNIEQQQSSTVYPAIFPTVPVNVPYAVQVPIVKQAVQPVQKFVQFAEEIPRSELGEVPEVAAARKAHLAAYEEIKKLLPTLEEIEAVQQPLVKQQVQIVTEQPKASTNLNQQYQVVSQVPQVEYQQSQNVVQQPAQPVQKFIQFAEEIPRSELGEVPEVAAARKAHLEAFEEIKKHLAQLGKTVESQSAADQPSLKQQEPTVNEKPEFVTSAPQFVKLESHNVNHQSQTSQIPQGVNQQSQTVPQDYLVLGQGTELSHQAQSEQYKKQLQRNLEWFYNPQQFYTFVPQDTPEVAAAKIEHLKLLQSFQ